MKSILLRPLLAPALVLVISGCATVASDWAEVRGRNTVQAYEEFLRQHPNSQEAAQARAALDELAWKEAELNNSLEAYENYFKRFPQAIHANEATDRTEELAWNKALTSDAIDGYQGFIKKYPDSKHTSEAKSRIWEGNVLVERFTRDGIGERFVLSVSEEILRTERLYAEDGATAIYYPNFHVIEKKMQIQPSPTPGKCEIDTMVAGVAPDGQVAYYGLPFGSGTVYRMTGEVRMLGVAFRSAGAGALEFLCLGDNRVVHIHGEGEVVDQSGKKIKLSEPVD